SRAWNSYWLSIQKAVQRIQSIRNCFQVSSGGIVKQLWKPKPQVEVSDRLHTSSTRNYIN
ncbi:MAG: hypothetical protein KGD72_00610, partial [Candidatus Lokiarchaeota archaeon]|nr:hypothetical protein [Candidatus Lokiarchaeota archaeon]